jgi:hypothetical protein
MEQWREALAGLRREFQTHARDDLHAYFGRACVPKPMLRLESRPRFSDVPELADTPGAPLGPPPENAHWLEGRPIVRDYKPQVLRYYFHPQDDIKNVGSWQPNPVWRQVCGDVPETALFVPHEAHRLAPPEADESVNWLYTQRLVLYGRDGGRLAAFEALAHEAGVLTRHVWPFRYYPDGDPVFAWMLWLGSLSLHATPGAVTPHAQGLMAAAGHTIASPSWRVACWRLMYLFRASAQAIDLFSSEPSRQAVAPDEEESKARCDETPRPAPDILAHILRASRRYVVELRVCLQQYRRSLIHIGPHRTDDHPEMDTAGKALRRLLEVPEAMNPAVWPSEVGDALDRLRDEGARAGFFNRSRFADPETGALDVARAEATLARLVEWVEALARGLRTSPLGAGIDPVPFITLQGLVEEFSPYWIEKYYFLDDLDASIRRECRVPYGTDLYTPTLIMFRERWFLCSSLCTQDGPDLVHDVRECPRSNAARLLVGLGVTPPESLRTIQLRPHSGREVTGPPGEKQDAEPSEASRAVSAAEPEPPRPAPNSRLKRSTARGEAQAKLIAALTKHHKYAEGGCLNPEPIGNNELARRAGVSPSTASDFFNVEFKGHRTYRAVCLNTGKLADSLKLLNDEFAPHELYGRRPADEDDRDE